MPKKKSKPKKNPATVITLTLPTAHDGGIPLEEASATLLIQRGDLAHMRQFYYHGILTDITDAIREASAALGLIQDNPPVIPDLPAEKPKSKAKTEKAIDKGEPTIDIPLKKGTQTVKMSAIKIVSGDSDAAAYRQATQLAGRLIDGKLWDGDSPIRFEDVYEVAKKMKLLTEKDFSLFSLNDFVQSGSIISPENDDESTTEDQSTPNTLA